MVLGVRLLGNNIVEIILSSIKKGECQALPLLEDEWILWN
jgi:hypothetical protein